MRALRWIVTPVAIGATAVAGCGGSSSTTTASTPTLVEQCRVGSGVSAHATTKSYEIQVNAGPTETMYTPSQVATQHVTAGEVMLGGQMTSSGDMSGMGGMAGMGGAATASDRHLEAHICSKTTGAPVQNASPTITVTNDAIRNVSADVPIAVMEGVGQGASDYHYGNNVTMSPGASYTVLVSLNGETATFRLQIPAAAAASSSTGGSVTSTPSMP